MAWKIEHWWDEVFPGIPRLFEEYQDLRPRELAIVAAAVLDSALVDIISRRFIDNPRESEKFLGANMDGRAPAGSFGARVQLALLLGIITESDALNLRAIQGIRNAFAHRARVNFRDKKVQKLLFSICREWPRWVGSERPLSAFRSFDELGKLLEKHPEVGTGLLLAAFGMQQLYFTTLIKLVDKNRIKPIYDTRGRAGFGALGIRMSTRGEPPAKN
ncbi:MAG: hypothetical protein WBS33_13055 [Verrucomicrobiia bacterium]